MKTKFVPLEDVLVIHEMIIETAGGKQGIRDFLLFHSAVSRPQASFGGQNLYPTSFALNQKLSVRPLPGVMLRSRSIERSVFTALSYLDPSFLRMT